MQRRPRDYLLFVGLLLCLIITLTESATVSIPVGVILDSKSSLGSMALSCINIALQDFYSTNDSYSTKLQLHFRDFGNDLTTAASAAWDLINNEKVHAIVGPQNLEQASSVVELGPVSYVPVIWFSSSGPSLLPPRSPFSIHSNSTRSHCFQFRAIAAIIEAYNWQSVIPIHEETEFGNDLIPCFSYAFHDMDTRVPYISAISQKFTEDEITKELNKIKDKQTYVFVAHMTVELWSRLLKYAQNAGLMNGGYAWILTQGLSSVTDPEAKDIEVKGYMEGALGVRQSLVVSDISKSKRHSLATTLKTKYDKTMSLYGLWAYDTITALAYAVENAGLVSSNESTVDLRNKTGPRLWRTILDTDFEGLSGNFSLREGQLEPSEVEVYNNVKGQGESIIGRWSPERGLFQNGSVVGEPAGKYNLSDPTWPGNTKERPPKLKIGIPKTSFTEFVNVSGEGKDITVIGGFAVDVFIRVVDVLPFPLSYEFVPLNNINPYDDLLCQIRDKNLDIIIGDITTIESRTNCVDFTLPYLSSSVAMVANVRSDSKSVWTLFKPFDPYLWLILGGFFLGATVIVIILEREMKDDEKSKFEDFVRNPFLIYKSDVGEDLRNRTSKWVVIVVMFLLTIAVQVYTANLTSILSERTKEKPSKWKDVQEIKRNNLSVGYQSDSWVERLLTDQMGFQSNQIKALRSRKEYDDALSNGVEAIFDETPYLMLLLSKCDSCKISGPIYKTGGFAFAFPNNSILVSSFSAAILQVTQDVNTIHGMKESNSLPVTIKESEYKSDVEMRGLTKGDFGGLFPLALFVLVLFFSLSILKLPAIASWLRSTLTDLVVWLHNKFVSFLSPSGGVISIKHL